MPPPKLTVLPGLIVKSLTTSPLNVEKWYSVLMEPVDWNAVHCALDDFRSESLVWLKGAVGA